MFLVFPHNLDNTMAYVEKALEKKFVVNIFINIHFMSYVITSIKYNITMEKYKSSIYLKYIFYLIKLIKFNLVIYQNINLLIIYQTQTI